MPDILKEKLFFKHSFHMSYIGREAIRNARKCHIILIFLMLLGPSYKNKSTGFYKQPRKSCFLGLVTRCLHIGNKKANNTLQFLHIAPLSHCSCSARKKLLFNIVDTCSNFLKNLSLHSYLN